MKIALIADELTQTALAASCDITHLTPLNYQLMLRLNRPDFLLVESAWQGRANRWKYKIASYADHPQRSNRSLRKVVALAKRLGIPTVFWNKEDGVHFERFIESAKLFEHIFTVDENCLPRYRALAPAAKTVATLMFAIEPSIHSYQGIGERDGRACFVGSYSTHVHAERQQRQHMLFSAAEATGLTLYDRNSGRKASHYRYPAYPYAQILPKVPYAKTADIYRQHSICLNVNTVEDSPTMFSRRLVEIIGCGGLCVTTPALSVSRLFADYCHIVENEEQAHALFARLAQGYSSAERQMIEAGAEYVHANHTWHHRLRQIHEAISASR